MTDIRRITSVEDSSIPGLCRLLAEVDGEIVGSVQLDLCGKENGRHRAEIQKLFVIRTHRGKSVSSALMQTGETFARTNGRTLLVLDTQAGSIAESVYRHLGWQRVGEIPGYAASPNGESMPQATSSSARRPAAPDGRYAGKPASRP